MSKTLCKLKKAERAKKAIELDDPEAMFVCKEVWPRRKIQEAAMQAPQAVSDIKRLTHANLAACRKLPLVAGNCMPSLQQPPNLRRRLLQSPLGGSLPFGDVAFNAVKIVLRRRRNKFFGVLLLRIRVDRLGRTELDDLPVVHHGHHVGHEFHHAQIVADEDVGQMPLRLATRLSRLSTWACTDTSSAETDSSQMRNSGSTASALAMQIRCRCPPENSCG